MLRIPLNINEDCYTFEEVDAMHRQAVWEIMWAFVLMEDEPASPQRLMIESAFDEYIGGRDKDQKRAREKEREEVEDEVNRVAKRTALEDSFFINLGRMPNEIIARVMRFSPFMVRALVSPRSTWKIIEILYDEMRRVTDIPRVVRMALLAPHNYMRIAGSALRSYNPESALVSERAFRRLFVLDRDEWKMGFGRLPLRDKVATLTLTQNFPPNAVRMLEAEYGRRSVAREMRMTVSDAFDHIYNDVAFFHIVRLKYSRNINWLGFGAFYLLTFIHTPEYDFMNDLATRFPRGASLDIETYQANFDDHAPPSGEGKNIARSTVSIKRDVLRWDDDIRGQKIAVLKNYPEGVRTMMLKGSPSGLMFVKLPKYRP